MLTCETEWLTCDTVELTCETEWLTCDTEELTCDTEELTCDTEELTCDTEEGRLVHVIILHAVAALQLTIPEGQSRRIDRNHTPKARKEIKV